MLKGSCREELKKVKHVVQYAVFAAYHLSLETSFLADEGATLPKITIKPSITVPENAISPILEVTNSPKYEHDVAVDHQNAHLAMYRSVIKQSDSPVVSLECSSPTVEEVISSEVTDASNEYYSSSDSNQSILVSFSSRCVLNGNVCERSRLLRIKFYGCFDKPLGRYLQDDLFDQVN